MTALACSRDLALKVCGWANDAAEARQLLDTLGLLSPSLPVVQPRPALELPRHGSRSAYVVGCRCNRCTSANARYVAGWRRRRLCTHPVVTTGGTISVVVLATANGRGRHRAWPGQLALNCEAA